MQPPRVSEHKSPRRAAPQTLTVMLYDPSTADAVQKAIMAAKVGMPRLEGAILLPLR